MRIGNARSISAGATLLGLVLLAAATAGAAEPVSGAPTERIATVPVGGAQVAIDPATGRLRPPTPEESRALARELARLFPPGAESARATLFADGTIGMTAGNEHFTFYLARVGAGGRLESACVDGLPAAFRFFGAPSPAVEEK
jgi:hypothetical protein